ncbi:hypothetical protein GCM10028796_46200 [Ramlibacter monticola]|uniref:Uncharacterized protein n=1 Tax=Ramlibacter monticola TaxID=1926872 RepID=A0A937CU20_9BURK|nr:hypothetical protein [Ramlibacter monticola]MBL0393210.1 hypothetical protein [Ramlibacter monticola]
MIRTREDLELQQDLKDAQREAAASEAVTARMRAQRSGPARQLRRTRRLRIVAVCAVLVSALGWTSLRVEGPSEVDLRHAPQVILLMAAEWTHDYMRRHGRAPARLGDELPVAADVQVQPHPGGARLSIRDSEGVEHSTFVSAGARP